jgi:hypothetical protein
MLLARLIANEEGSFSPPNRCVRCNITVRRALILAGFEVNGHASSINYQSKVV